MEPFNCAEIMAIVVFTQISSKSFKNEITNKLIPYILLHNTSHTHQTLVDIRLNPKLLP